MDLLFCQMCQKHPLLELNKEAIQLFSNHCFLVYCQSYYLLMELSSQYFSQVIIYQHFLKLFFLKLLSIQLALLLNVVYFVQGNQFDQELLLFLQLFSANSLVGLNLIFHLYLEMLLLLHKDVYSEIIAGHLILERLEKLECQSPALQQNCSLQVACIQVVLQVFLQHLILVMLFQRCIHHSFQISLQILRLLDLSLLFTYTQEQGLEAKLQHYQIFQGLRHHQHCQNSWLLNLHMDHYFQNQLQTLYYQIHITFWLQNCYMIPILLPTKSHLLFEATRFF